MPRFFFFFSHHPLSHPHRRITALFFVVCPEWRPFSLAFFRPLLGPHWNKSGKYSCDRKSRTHNTNRTHSINLNFLCWILVDVLYSALGLFAIYFRRAVNEMHFEFWLCWRQFFNIFFHYFIALGMQRALKLLEMAFSPVIFSSYPIQRSRHSHRTEVARARIHPFCVLIFIFHLDI